MTINVLCAGCKQKLTFPAHFAGRTVQCPSCMAEVKLGTAGKGAAPPGKPAAGSGEVRPQRPASAPAAAPTGAKKPGPAAPPPVPPAVRKPSAPSRQNLAFDDGPLVNVPRRPERSSGGRKVFMAFFILLLLGGLGAGGYFGYKHFFEKGSGPDPVAGGDKDGEPGKDVAPPKKDKEGGDPRWPDTKIIGLAPGDLPAYEGAPSASVKLPAAAAGFCASKEADKLYLPLATGAVEVFDLNTRDLAAAPAYAPSPGEKFGAVRIALSPDGKKLAIASPVQKIYVRDLATKETITLAQGPPVFGLEQMAFSADSARLVCFHGRDRGFKVWDIAGKRPAPEFVGPAASMTNIQSAGIDPRGEFIVVGGSKNDLYLFDAATGKEVWKSWGHADRGIDYVARAMPAQFAADGKKIAMVWGARNVHVYDAAKGTHVAMLDRPGSLPGEVESMAFSDDGRRLAVGDRGAVHLFELPSGKFLGSLDADQKDRWPVRRVHFSQEDRLVIGSDQDRLFFWTRRYLPWDGGVELARLPLGTDPADRPSPHNLPAGVINAGGEAIHAFVPSADGARIYYTTSNGAVLAFHTKRRFSQKIIPFAAGTNPSANLALSPDEKLLARSLNNGIQLIDIDKKEARLLVADSGFAGELAFSGDGTRILGFNGSRLRSWEVATGKPAAEFKEAAARWDSVPSAAMAASRGAATGRTRDLHAFDPATGAVTWKADVKPEFKGRLDASPIPGACSRDGRLAAFLFEGKHVMVWDLEARAEVADVEIPADLIASGYRPLSLALAGNRLAIGLDRGVVRIYETPGGKFLGTLTLDRPDGVHRVEFSHDERLVLGRGPNYIAVWNREFQPWDSVLVVAKKDPPKKIVDPPDKKVDPPIAKAGEKVLPHGSFKLDQPIRHFIADRSGSKLYVLQEDASVAILDLAGGGRDLIPAPAGVKLEKAEHGGLALSPDGKTLARAVHNMVVDVIDLSTKAATVHADPRESYDAREVHFTPDGGHVVILSSLGAVRRRDLATKAEAYFSRDMGLNFFSKGVALAPDGTFLASSAGGSVLLLCELATGRIVLTDKAKPDLKRFESYEAGANSIAVSGDSKRVAIGWESDVRIWHVPSQKQRSVVLDLNAGLVGKHRAGRLAFLGEGDRLAVATSAGAVQVFDILTGQRRAYLDSGTVGAVRGLQVLPGPSQPLLAAIGNEIKIWSLAKTTLDPVDPALAAAPDPEGIVPVDWARLGPGKGVEPKTGGDTLLPARALGVTFPENPVSMLRHAGFIEPFIDGAELGETVFLVTPDGRLVMVDERKGKREVRTFQISGKGAPYMAHIDFGRDQIWLVRSMARPEVDEFGRHVVSEATLDLCRFRDVLSGGRKDRDIVPETSMPLKGKVVQFIPSQADRGGVIYLDVGEPAKPAMRAVDLDRDGKRLVETYTLNCVPGTFACGVSSGRWLALTSGKDATLYCFDRAKGEQLFARRLPLQPFCLHGNIVTGSDGSQGVIVHDDLTVGGKPRIVASGVPAKLTITGPGHQHFAAEPTAEGVHVYVFDRLAADAPVWMGAMTRRGGGKGKIIRGNEGIYLDTGDILEVVPRDTPVVKKEKEPDKRGLLPSRAHKLSPYGSVAAFLDGFEARGRFFLFGSGKQMIYWPETDRINYTFNLTGGPGYLATYCDAIRNVYTLSPTDRPPVEERGRYILDNPELARYEVDVIMDGKGDIRKPLAPAGAARLKGKVSQFECDGRALFYLDIADPKRPKLRRLHASTLEETMEIELLPNTFRFRLADRDNIVCLANDPDATVYCYNTEKKALTVQDAAKVAPHDMVINPRTMEIFVSGTEEGRAGLLAFDFAAPPGKAERRFFPGFPEMGLARSDRFLFGCDLAAMPGVFLMHDVGRETSVVEGRGYAEAASTMGPARGKVVAGQRYVILSNGQIFQRDKAGDVAKKPPMPKGDPGGDKLTYAGAIDPFLGGFVDADAKAAIFVHPKSTLKVFAYPTLKPRAAWRLPGTAQRAALDPGKGLLYALVPNLKAGDPFGKRGGSQVMVFGIRDLLDAKTKPVAGKDLLSPERTINLPGFATNMFLSPDGEWLYLLENKDNKSARALRVSTAKGEVMGAVPLHELADGLSLAPDGKMLYAVSHVGLRSGGKATGKLHVIDALEMKARDPYDLAIDPNDVEAANDGLVFLTSYATTRNDMLLFDAAAGKVVAVWKGTPGGSCLRLEEGGKRIFVRNTRSTPTSAACLPIPAVAAESEMPRATWGLGPAATTRGEFLLTPDGRFLICESGAVFAIGAAPIGPGP